MKPCGPTNGSSTRRSPAITQLFAREDAIEETWRIVQPLLDKPSRIHHYDRGSWGPEAAQSLLRGHHRWQEPWLPQSTHAAQ